MTAPGNGEEPLELVYQTQLEESGRSRLEKGQNAASRALWVIVLRAYQNAGSDVDAKGSVDGVFDGNQPSSGNADMVAKNLAFL